MPIADDVALNAYITAVTTQEVALVCVRHVSGYGEAFEQAFEAWSRRNAQEVSQGDAVATAKGWKKAGPTSIQAMARMQASLVEQLPADDRARRCSELLVTLAKAQQK